MTFKTSVKKSFGNVKKDMSELKVTLLELMSSIVKNQAVMNARLKKVEDKLNLNERNLNKIKVELR